MTSVDRRPYLAVTVGGTPIEAISARVQQGFLLNSACADVDVRTLPVGITPWDIVQITMGATLASAAVRFTGYFVSHEANLYENSYKLNCKGYLFRAETYRATANVDMSYIDTIPPTHGHLDEVQVSTVLYIVGLSGSWVPSGEDHMTSIEGTSRTIGKYCKGKCSWSEGQTALSYIQELDAICLGYRTFDTADGTIVRQQITTTPSSASLTFTEGVDIFRASATDTVLDAKNKFIVNGFNRNGKDTEALKYTATGANSWLYLPTADHPEGEQWYVVETLSSAMIEQQVAGLDPSEGLSCEEVANWLLAENNVRRIHCQFTTPRDDLIDPGDTIAISASTYMGISQSFWVQEVDCSLSGEGFSQVLTCIAPVAGLS